MKKNYVFVILITLYFLLQINQVFAQNWVWKTGSNVINQTGTYGTVGVSSLSNSPGARNGSITFTDNSGNLWLFGGRDNSGNLFNDLWKYNISTNQWTWIKGSSAINSLASYGAQGVSSFVNAPGSRCNGVGWVDGNDNFWIFGGEGYTNSLSNFGNLNDLWKYNISTNQWTWVKGPSSIGDLGVYGTIGIANNNNNPSARNVSCGWIHNNKLYLFGGNASTIGYIGDLWVYDISTNQWTWIKGSSTGSELPLYGTQGISNNNNVPGARAGECVWNNNTGELYLFGGSKGSNMFYSDLWKYNISTNQWTWLKGPNTTNVVGSYGTQGVSSSTNNPGARYKSVGNWISSNNLYLFGGYGYYSNGGPNYMNDLWKLDLTSLQWTFIKGSTGAVQIGNYGTQGITSSTNNPGAREYHSSWNDNNGNFWLFGGWGFANNSTFGLLNDLWVYNNPCSSISAPTGSALQTLCSGSTVANLTATGTAIKWYSSATGGTALASTTALVNGTTYYASQTVSGCESTTRIAVTVTINNPTVSASLTSVCSSQPTTLTASAGTSTTSNFSVGSIGPSGGYVFYDKGSVTNGWRYLEAAPSDISAAAEWGCLGTTISGISNAIGTGQTNTNLIIAGCSTQGIASHLCDQASINGFSDWYLPSKDEFNSIYQNLYSLGLGNFNNNTGPNSSVISTNRYWTSSQVTPFGWAQDFTPYFQQIVGKSELCRVRPIRQFASGTPFSSYLWSTGGTTASISVNPTTSTQYWVDITTNGVTCRKFITITVNSTTSAPTGSNLQTLCSGSTVANLTATGTNIKWYATSTGGTALASTTALVNGTTYYASQTVSGCESTTRLEVIVSLNNPTVSASSTTICGGTNVTLTANSNLTTTQIQTQVDNLVNTGLWDLSITYDGHYYLKYQTTMTWTQAKVFCEQNGGYLYCPNSQLENDNVSFPIANGQAFGNFLLGLYQDTNDVNFSEPSGGWKWLDGTPLTYTNWAQNEPNNNGGGENYNVMDWNNNGAVWNDITDVVNGTVIMEYPGITSYLWSTGETSQTINPSPNQTTQYWVDVTSNGVTCRKFITVNVNINIAPSISITAQSSCASPTGTVQINSPISGGITPQNIFISEVTDSNAGTLSYIELFNKTGNSIDLSNYKIKVYNNGGTTPNCVSLLSGLIANNSTYVIKLSADANQNGIVPNFTLASCGAVNTDDNIRLTTANDVEIDIWGRIDGVVFTPNGQSGYTYRRNSNAILPSTTWSPVDWDAIDPEDYTNIGTYVFPTNNVYNYSVDGGAFQTSTIFSGLAVGNHTITVKDMTTGCTSSTTFTIQSASVVPTGNIAQTFCSGATVSNLLANGTTIKWYLSSTGGTALSSSTLLLNNTSYFATQTINGCESQTRLEVKVTLVNVQINTPNTIVCPGGSTTLTATDLNNLSSTNCLNVSAQLQNGLQAFYPFCGNANDISGNSLNGTVVGATITSDRFGNLNSAYSFGQNQQINIPNTSGRNTYPLTISLWYNTSTVSDGQGQNGRSIFTKYTPASWNGFGIGLFDYSNEGQGLATAPLYLRNTSNRVIGLYNESAFNQSNVQFNTWYHVVFTLDANGGKMYLNGQLISTHNWTGTAGPSTSSNLWKIGGKWDYWFNGKIDDVAVWNRVLSPIEVQEIYSTPMTTTSSTYLWSTGETTPTISVSPTQTTQYSVAVTTNGVTCTKNITITVGSATPAPTGVNNQTMIQGSTLANLVVTGQNIVWYSSPFGGTPLPLNTPLVNGVTYYASQTINGCESQFRLPVIVQVTLSNEAFDTIKIVYNPNPVIDILNIKASTELKNAKICNLLGQTIFQQRFNSNEIILDMSDVPTGTYFVIVESDDRKETFKILKK